MTFQEHFSDFVRLFTIALFQSKNILYPDPKCRKNV